MSKMKAVVINEAGGPEVLKFGKRPVPVPHQDQVLIKVKCFGLNRSELSHVKAIRPVFSFPEFWASRLQEKLSSALMRSSRPATLWLRQWEVWVVTLMAVREFIISATSVLGVVELTSVGYAEFACVPTSQVQKITVDLPWETLGALPEMLQTAYGALFIALQLHKGQTLLIRGGTTSVGLAAATIAKDYGCVVISTTRKADSASTLVKHGATHVVIDDGKVAPQVRKLFTEGVDKVGELVGTTTLEDSLKCVKKGGIACMSGMVGNSWSFPDFAPMESIPTAVSFTTYSGGSEEFMQTPLNELCLKVKDGVLDINVGKIFQIDEIVKAHRCMEENRASGKIVVLV
jgi:NADPH:quinone reductase-like Zn-dependent oxidoreductase